MEGDITNLGVKTDKNVLIRVVSWDRGVVLITEANL